MRTGIFVLLLLSAVWIGSSDAGWLKRAWQNVKKAVKDAVDWVKEHCSYDGGIKCSFNRTRREVRDLADPYTLQSENELCDKILTNNPLLHEGLTFDLIKEVFEQVDRGQNGDLADGDNTLDEAEFGSFMETLEVLHYCLLRAK